MGSLGDIFREFCKYVDERIFSEENAGTYVAFVIDQAFIDEFCKLFSVYEKDLMKSVRHSLYGSRKDTLFVKGITAIQLYAASKRANDGYITEKNYRDRLSQVLSWDIYDLQSWMSYYQEDIWSTLYEWCDKHYFQITKCQKKFGTGRYVQYPVNQALRVFTDEDLKYIASCFVEKSLSPSDDLQKRDFKRIISRYDILQAIQTNHGRLVIENSISSDDYYNQVYNYFLRWDGKYKERYSERKSVERNAIDQLFLYLPDDFSRLEFRKKDLSLKKKYNIDSISYDTIAENYNFKRRGLILFKHDDVYDNYWQETWYLEGKEEGLILLYPNHDQMTNYKLRPFLVYSNKYVNIYNISYNSETRDFYTNKRTYELYGGLKIGRQIYIHGAAPVLRLEQPTRIWIDGKAFDDDESYGDISLDHLSIGSHYIKIQNFKRIEFELQKPSVESCPWMSDYCQWQMNIKEPQWESCNYKNGVIGLDFSSISPNTQTINTPSLKRWADYLTFGKSYDNESNVTIKILKNQAYD